MRCRAGFSVGLALAVGLAPAPGAGASDTDLCRVQLGVDPTLPFVEQAVRWELRIEASTDVHTIEWIEAPAFPGTRAERVTPGPDPAAAPPRGPTVPDLRSPRNPELPSPPVSKDLQVRIDQRVLFPERAGPLELPAARLACSAGARTVELRLPPRRLEVRPLPSQDRPHDFGGLVGRPSVRRSLDPLVATLGEAFSATVELRGGGNLWAAPDPFAGPAPEGIEVLRRPDELGVERSGALELRRSFRAELVPRRTGHFALPELRVAWFDPETEHYAETRLAPLEFEVTERSQPAPAPPAPGGPAADAVLPLAWAWTALRLAAAIAALGLLLMHLRRRHRRAARPSAAPPPSDPLAALERSLRDALARRGVDTGERPAAELQGAADLPAPEREALQLLMALERARFDRGVAAPSGDAVTRALAALDR